MDELVERLRGLADTPPTSPEPLGELRRRATRLRRRRRWAGSGAAAAVLVAAGGGFVTVMQDGPGPSPVAVEVGQGPATTATTAGLSASSSTTLVPPISAPAREPAWRVPNPASGRFLPTSGRPEVAGDLVLVPGGFDDVHVRAYRAGSGSRLSRAS